MDAKKISVIKTKHGYEATYQEIDKSLSIIRDSRDKAINDLISLWNENNPKSTIV